MLWRCLAIRQYSASRCVWLSLASQGRVPAGDRDAAAQAVSVQARAVDDLGAMPVFQVIDRLKDEVVTGMNPEEAIGG